MAEMDKEGPLICQFCWQGSEVEDVAGHLHAEKIDSGKLISAHHRCMQYASGLTQYKCEVFGGFDIAEVEKEIARGQKLRCFICKGSKGKKCRGASCGCAVKFCRKSFHYTCASNDPVAVTKRLVVTKNKLNPDDKFVLYRVFCSPAHEEVFRKALKDDLRGSTRKRHHTKSIENPSGPETEVLEMGQKSADAGRNGDVSVASPVANGSLDASKSLNDSSLLMASPDLSSTGVANNTDDEDGMVSTENSDDNTSMQEDSMLSSPLVTSSCEPGKAQRRPGATQPRLQGTKPDVSQPLLCRLTEELSTMHQGKEGSGGGKRNADSGQDGDEPEIHNGWHPKGPEFMTASSPGEESMENKSPNIPHVPSKTPVKVMKALTGCLGSVENGMVLHAHSENAAKAQTPVLDRKAEPSPDKAVVICKKGAKVAAGKLSSGQPRHVSKPTKAGRSRPISSVASGHASSQDSSRSVPHSESEDSVSKSVAEVSVSQESSTVDQQGEVREEDKGSASLKAGNVRDVRSEADSSTAESRSGGTKHSDGQKGGSRKRKRSESGFHSADEECVGKTSKDDVTSTCELQQAECVLLIPGSMEEFQTQEGPVTQAVCGRLKVGPEQLYVWQTVTLKSLPAPLLLLFMLDLVKELQKENHEGVLDMLFDGECLTSKVNNYLVAQAQVLQAVSDEKMQQDIQATMWSGLEKSVGSLSTVHLIHGDKGLATLALDGRCFKLGHHIMANIQAYTGLFGWSKDMEALTFPMSPGVQRLAVQTEALALKAWLTRVNPISEVTVLPSDDLLYDKTESIANQEFFRLAEYLRAKTHAAILMEDAGGSPVQRIVPLLVFQPVEVFMLNFQEYFQKACDKFFQTRGLVSGLVLVPLSNLYSGKEDSISALLKGKGETESRYRVSVYSAFCPSTQPTSMVLLEVALQECMDTMVQLAQSSDKSTGDTMTLKRKRGRPRKSLNP